MKKTRGNKTDDDNKSYENCDDEDEDNDNAEMIIMILVQCLRTSNRCSNWCSNCYKLMIPKLTLWSLQGSVMLKASL